MARPDGQVYASGSVPTEAVWTDNPPTGSSLELSQSGLGPASYEIREWAPDPHLGRTYRDDLVGDVFQFADTAQAHRFFGAAGSVRCHRSGSARVASRPHRARNLIWVNPDARTQEDVFVLDASTVYRIADVRPGSSRRPSWDNEQRLGVATVDRLACAFVAPLCPKPDVLASFREHANEAICSLNGELLYEYRGHEEAGPWALFPVYHQTRLNVANFLQQLVAITPPAAQAAPYARLITVVQQLLKLGGKWNADEVAGDPRAAQEDYEAAAAVRDEFLHLTNGLDVTECTPIKVFRATG
jgi:hypothetical protein